MHRLVRVVLVLVAGLCAAGPASASAATVTIGSPTFPSGTRVGDVKAGPGEANAMTIDLVGATMTVRDTGTPPTAGAGCAVVDAATVACTSPDGGRVVSAFVALGDRDDSVTLTGGGPLFADGGAGSDTLRGSTFSDRLAGGGGGHDTLVGGGTADNPFASRDMLSDGDTDRDHDADVFDGGGDARVSYVDRTDDLLVDLSGERPSGAPGEGDRLSAVTAAAGGSGDDRIVGTEGDDDLSGSLGDDQVLGRGGDDIVFGGDGDDLLRGSAGDDVLMPREGDDEISCGDGTDVVEEPEAGEVMSFRCETATYELPDTETWTVRPTPQRVGRSTVRWRFGCPAEYDSGRTIACDARLTLREAGGRKRLLGRGSFRGAAGRDASTPIVRLNALGRRLARKGAAATLIPRGSRPPSIRYGIPRREWSFVLRGLARTGRTSRDALKRRRPGRLTADRADY